MAGNIFTHFSFNNRTVTNHFTKHLTKYIWSLFVYLGLWSFIYLSHNFLDGIPPSTWSNRGSSLCSPRWSTLVSRAAVWFLLKSTLSAAEIPISFSSHSYQIGAATMVAQQGLPDYQIKTVGRWSSNAYQLYVKTPVQSYSWSGRQVIITGMYTVMAIPQDLTAAVLSQSPMKIESSDFKLISIILVYESVPTLGFQMTRYSLCLWPLKYGFCLILQDNNMKEPKVEIFHFIYFMFTHSLRNSAHGDPSLLQSHPQRERAIFLRHIRVKKWLALVINPLLHKNNATKLDI